MNKKLIALAVAGASLAPVVASAQTANPVTLYGRAWVMFESVKADGGTAAPIPSRNRVSDVGPSFIGVRGTEDIGGGLKAFFQMEYGFRLDENNASGTPFSGRNSAVGLQGNFGSILLGRWDTPWKTATIAIDPYGTVSMGGLTTGMQDRGNFDRRENNTVQYWSPNLSGFQARAGYVANEGRTSVVNPTSTSFSGTYTQGPFYVGYVWERHKDQYKSYTGAIGNVAGASERGQALFGNVTLGAFKLGAMAQKFKKENPNNGVASRNTESRAQMFAATYTAGKNVFIYSYITNKDSTFQTAGAAPLPVEAVCKVNTLGYNYEFSRRTTFMAQYVQIKNNVTGLCNLSSNAVPGLVADQDPRGFGVGLRHFF